MNPLFRKWQEHLEAGIKCLGKGHSSEAEEYLKVSLIEAEALALPIIIAFSQRLLAVAQIRNNKVDEAELGFRRALLYCIKLSNNKGISEAKAGLASIYYIKGQYIHSVFLYKQAIKIYPRESSPLRLAVLYSDLGQVYSRLKKWNKAEDVFIKSGNICKNHGYSRGEAEVNLFLGEVYYSQGKTKVAIERFIKAAKIFGLIGEETSLINAHQYLAFICFENNMIQEALLYQHRVITLNLRNNQLLEISEGYYLLSNIQQYAKLFEQADESLKLSLKYYTGIESGYAVRYQSLAVNAIMRKDYAEAKRYYHEALKYYELYGDGSKIGEISEELTYLLRYEDVYKEVNLYKWLEERDFQMNISKYEILHKLSKSLINRGDNIAALRCGWRALEIAKMMEYETQEIEKLIQNISERIRKK